MENPPHDFRAFVDEQIRKQKEQRRGQREERMKSILPQDSPLYSLYEGSSKLENYLSIPKIREATLSFGAALRFYMASAELSNPMVCDTVKMSRDSGLIQHLMHDSGRKQYQGYQYPRVHSKYFFRFGLDNEGPTKNSPRIVVAFYDEKTGGMVLRTGSGMRQKRNIESLTDMAIQYLSLADQTSEERRANYIKGILVDRFRDRIKHKIPMFMEREGDNVPIPIKMNNVDFDVKHARTARVMKIANQSLGLVPVYLLPCLREEELMEKRQLIVDHIARLSQVQRQVSSDAVEAA